MGRAIGLTIVAMLLFLGYSWLMFVWGAKFHEHVLKKEGLAGLKGIHLTKEAAKILSRLGIASTLDDVEIINPANQAAIKEWLGTYNKYVERVK
jgi:hypothetical protein